MYCSLLAVYPKELIILSLGQFLSYTNAVTVSLDTVLGSSSSPYLQGFYRTEFVTWDP